MHNHDVDNFPSVPHCHADEENWKLHIYFGEIFENKKMIAKMTKKELNILWGQKGFKELVNQVRNWYETLHQKDPNRYPSLPNCTGTMRFRKSKLKIGNRRENQLFRVYIAMTTTVC